jgi:Ca2+-binding RTX toxin-like protein
MRTNDQAETAVRQEVAASRTEKQAMATIYGTNGNDRDDLGGTDLIGTAQHDTIYGLGGSDLLDGLGGNDHLDGGSGINTIRGGAGYDYVKTAHGSGWYDGGSESDIIDFTALSQAGWFDLGAGWGSFSSQTTGRFTMVNFENIYTGNGWDTIWGTNGVNEIRSGSGWDTVHALGGHDTVRAGVGDDYVDGGTGDDWIDGAEGWDELFGGLGNDLIYGGSGVDLLWGGHGDDRLVGGLGSDTVDGGESGFDTAYFSDLSSLHSGVTVDMPAQKATYGHNGIWETDNLFRIDKVVGSYGSDKMIAGATTEFDGNGGHDNILSGSGANRLHGGLGNDWINYEKSTAGVVVNLQHQTASGGWAAGDVLSSFEHAGGSAHVDLLRGSNGENMLAGGAGNDTIYGDGGADRIWGDAGRDTIWGGSGGDRFLFMTSTDSAYTSGPDRIHDFSAAQGDRIVLKMDANWHLNGKQGFTSLLAGADGWDGAFRAGTIGYHYSGGDTYVDINLMDHNSGNGYDAPEMQIRLTGIHNLTWSSFEF